MELDHLAHGIDIVFRKRFVHAAAARIAVTRKWPHRFRQKRTLFVGFPGHDCGDRAAKSAAFHGIVAVAIAHDERAEIGITETQSAKNVGVLGDLFDRVAGVIDNDFLGGDENADRGLESFHIEGAIGRFELHQIE